MKKIITILCLVFFLIACSKEPFEIQLTKQIFVDETTASDTIIINYNHQYLSLDTELYFAEKNWQTNLSSTTNRSTRTINIRTVDTVDLATNIATINQAYYFKIAVDGLSLESQHLLLLPTASTKRKFIRL
ncbi:MAG: hypothetical protein MUE72_12415 [Chitinophagaceae bacterium]|nr:hypothetical protein [Chitinophagaceae bacterium]